MASTILSALLMFGASHCTLTQARPNHPSLHLRGSSPDRDPILALDRRANESQNHVLPPHHWELAKSQDDIDALQKQHNLVLVESTPQEAAMMPNWPQAFLQYFLISPIFDCTTSRHDSITTSYTTSYTSSTTIGNGYSVGNSYTPAFTDTYPAYERGHSVGFWQVLQMIFLPFTFTAWIVSFGIVQSSPRTAGWLSVMGWTSWLDPMDLLLGRRSDSGFLCLLPLLFQWCSSLAVIIQRWGSLGDIAYQIDNLNGCVPIDGLDYLQKGARSWNFRVLQTVNFSLATLYTLFYLPAIGAKSPSTVKSILAATALGELIYEAVVASRGTPLVVSGNCLLVELNPSKGFLDSSISTTWKAFASFMGF